MFRFPVIPTQKNPYHSGVESGTYYAVSVNKDGICTPLFKCGPGGRLSLIKETSLEVLKECFSNSINRTCLDGLNNNFIALRENDDRTYCVVKTRISINGETPGESGGCALSASVSYNNVDSATYDTEESAFQAAVRKAQELKIPLCSHFWTFDIGG